MADYLGVERNTVGRYINGRSAPDMRTLRLRAMRCGVPLPWLLTGDAPSPGDQPTVPSLSLFSTQRDDLPPAWRLTDDLLFHVASRDQQSTDCAYVGSAAA